MAWKREHNTGQKNLGETWSISATRPDATNALTFAATRMWNAIFWTKETKSASAWTKET